MKLYGKVDKALSIEEITTKELAEVTLCATAGELQRLSEFLTFCASEMERMGAVYDHIHLSDRLKEFEGSPHFVVMKAT
jgi:hypothetical protein